MDDIVLIAETEDEIKNITNILSKEEKEKSLNIKYRNNIGIYRILSRKNYRTYHLKIEDYTFERVRNFKYLCADINEKFNSHEEV